MKAFVRISVVVLGLGLGLQAASLMAYPNVNGSIFGNGVRQFYASYQAKDGNWNAWRSAAVKSPDTQAFFSKYFGEYNTSAYKFLKDKHGIEFEWAKNVTEFDKAILAMELLADGGKSLAKHSKGTKLLYYVDEKTMASRKEWFENKLDAVSTLPSFGSKPRTFHLNAKPIDFGISLKNFDSAVPKIEEKDGKIQLSFAIARTHPGNDMSEIEIRQGGQFVRRSFNLPTTFTLGPIEIEKGMDLDALKSAIVSNDGNLQLGDIPGTVSAISTDKGGRTVKLSIPQFPVGPSATDRVIAVTRDNRVFYTKSASDLSDDQMKTATMLAVTGSDNVREVLKRKAALKVSSAEDEVEKLLRSLKLKTKPTEC